MKKSLRETNDALSNFGKELNEAGDAAERNEKKFDLLKTTIVGIGTVAVGVGAALIAAGDESKQALNDIQAATGASTEEMAKYKTVMDNVVASNFGDGFRDVADTISLVTQQLGDLDAVEMENVTKNLYLLQDTFDMDINESLRGAEALMNEFGLSSDEAFNLMAQGAQNGLNQNQDLADQLAEYAPLYADLGLSAEDMFNAMKNGADEGAYQIDFLNDAVKEFGIRTKDGSDATKEAFTALGLDADEMSNKFAQGGDVAKEAFQEVNKALFSLDDPLQQNQIGVQLWGTKFEDMGIDAIQALTNIDGEISNTTDALGAINEVKYDSIGENISLLKKPNVSIADRW